MKEEREERTLDLYGPGDTITITAYHEERARRAHDVRVRLEALGFVEGTRVEILRRAPLGDPTEYALRGTRISLRRTEAALIHATPTEPRR